MIGYPKFEDRISHQHANRPRRRRSAPRAAGPGPPGRTSPTSPPPPPLGALWPSPARLRLASLGPPRPWSASAAGAAGGAPASRWVPSGRPTNGEWDARWRRAAAPSLRPGTPSTTSIHVTLTTFPSTPSSPSPPDARSRPPPAQIRAILSPYDLDAHTVYIKIFFKKNCMHVRVG